MFSLLLISLVDSLLSEILVFLAIILLVFVIFKLGKFILRLIFGIIANSILGFAAILAVNYLFGVGITYTTPVLIATALFGLPGVGAIIILKLFGALA